MIGNPILELHRVDSTSIYANAILEKGDVSEGTTIWAYEQYAGKGQNNNKWESEPGRNLTFSIILKPVFLDPALQFYLAKAISLGLVDFIDSSLQGYNIIHPETNKTEAVIKIKWPNDIFIHSGKVAGILIENKILGSRIGVSVIGIGLNINQTIYSSEIPNPVSLLQILRREIELKEALKMVCQALDLRYNSLRQGNLSKLDHDYCRYLLGLDEWRKFRINGKTVERKITGVDDSGRLVVLSPDKVLSTFNHKEIEYII